VISGKELFSQGQQ